MEESGASDAEDTSWSLSDEWLVGQTAPLALTAARCGVHGLHAALGELVPALLLRRRFTVSFDDDILYKVPESNSFRWLIFAPEKT